MEFRVLGSIEASSDGQAVSLGGTQQRRLLGVLLADAGRVVPVSRLIEAVWPGDAAPDGALRTTRTYVSRLRTALGGGFVVSRDHGYVLDLTGATFDRQSFEELVGRARDAEGVTAVERYDRALGQWRGPAFAEFADEWWARPEATRLDELRLVVVEERVDALLALDRHTEVVPELEGLVFAYPYRERLTALLMVALGRGGREVDAHRAYQAFRNRLGTDTGLEPSADLARLDGSIAAGDSTTAASNRRRLRGYVIGELLGEGTFGVVYRATQPGLGRDVALKMIRAELADDAGFVRRFEAEAQLVARLEHPHIVALYDFWREPGAAYLVFRLLRGGNAEQSLQCDGPWPLDRVDRLVEEIGGALVVAHRAGVAHRDVKPANILFDDAGRSYLADFGIAAANTVEDGYDTTRAAPPHDSSPPDEGLSGERVGARSDQYGLALTLWELLTGEMPFPDAYRTSATGKRRQGLPVLDRRRPDLGEGVSAVLAKAGAARPEDRYASMAEMLLAWRRALDKEPQPVAVGTAGRLDRGRNPYKGLRAFQEADAAEYFGRTALVHQIHELVGRKRFVTVVGPSGSGKSSLVHAGLVPRLRADERILVASMVPDANPFAALSVALSRVATGTVPIEPDALASPGGIVRAAREIGLDGGDLVLVIDQFEEFWTVSDIDARDGLLEELARAMADRSSSLRVVATVRADFFDRPLQDPHIGALVAGATLGVTPLTPTELVEAIVEPARGLGVDFESGLPAEILADVVGQPASLPLLQFALAELYDRRHDSTLTVADYRSLGGIAGAVARQADELFASLDADAQREAHEMFTRLVAIGDGTGDSRRRVRVSELSHISPTVIERFSTHRLLAFDRDPATREPTVEVAHEALLVQWPRLRAWLDDDRDWLRLRRHLSVAADTWEAGGREQGELYRGARLGAALETLGRHEGSLTDRELGFLEASRVARDADADRQRRVTRRLRRLLSAAAVALVVAVVAAAVAVVQQRSARDSSYRAETGRLLATARSLDTGDTPVAALLALEAGRRRGVDRNDVAASLQQVLTAKPSFLGSFPTVGEYAFGRDGATFVARTAKGVEVYDLADHTLRARVEHPAIRGIPGRRLATGDNDLLVETAGDTAVNRYRLPTLEPAGAPIVTPGSVTALAMSPNGTLATGQAGGLVVVWDASTATERLRIHVDSDPQRLDLSADGTKLAVLTFTSAQVWDTGTGQPAGPPVATSGSDIALSPNGQRVVVASASGPNTLVFDAATATQTAAPEFQGVFVRFIDDDRIASSSGPALAIVDAAHGGTVLNTATTTCGCDIALSPDGHTLATGLDGPGLYALDGRELLADAYVAPANPAEFSETAVSADGRRLSVSGFSAGTTVLEHRADGWNVSHTLSGRRGAVTRDGHLFEIDSGTGVGSIVDLDAGATVRSFPGPPVPTLGFDMSADNRFAAYGSFDGSVTVIDTQSATVVARLDDLKQLNTGNDFGFITFVSAPRFSVDGRWLVASTWSGAAVAWDTRNWERAAVLEPGIADVNGSATPAFDPTGRLLAVSRGRSSMALFDAATLTPIRQIPLGVQGLPYQAAFDPTGHRLVVVLDTQQALTFDVDSGRRLGAPIPATYQGGVAFTDPTTLAVPDLQRGLLRVWNLDPARLEAQACRAAGRNLTRDEWARLGPAGEPYRLTCPQFGEPPADPTLSVEQKPVTVVTAPK